MILERIIDRLRLAPRPHDIGPHFVASADVASLSHLGVGAGQCPAYLNRLAVQYLQKVYGDDFLIVKWPLMTEFFCDQFFVTDFFGAVFVVN